MKPICPPLTMTICLVAIIFWTGSPSHAGHKHALIIKAKQRHANRHLNLKTQPLDSARVSEESSKAKEKKANTAPELKQENLQIEVLTGGKWVPITPSSSIIETTNLPLRISYLHLQNFVTPVKLKLDLKKHHDKIRFENSDLKLPDSSSNPSSHGGYPSGNQSSVVYPRLTAGIYSITISADHQCGIIQILRETLESLLRVILEPLISIQEPKENTLTVWLKVRDTPLEPPIISAVDQRLAREEGKLSLQLENVVENDKVTIFVNGLEFPSRNSKKENTNLHEFSNFKSPLPPGISTVIARIERQNETSNYSRPVTVTSRSTVVLRREIEIKKTDFLKSSSNKLAEDRTQSEKKFKKLNQDVDKQEQKKISKQESSFDLFPLIQFSTGDNFTLLPLYIQLNPELKKSIESLESQIQSNNTQIVELKDATDKLKKTIDNLVESLTQESFFKEFICKYLMCTDSTQQPLKLLTHTNEQSPEENTSATDSSTNERNKSEDKIALQEFAFPYPATFPISRFSRDGDRIKTEGIVLDQMRLAIAKDGRYQLDFDARTTMRAEIKLQLFIKLKDGRWYPLTLPRQTILPSNYRNHRFGADSGNETSYVSITGYAPILVNQQDQITDIRRRGSATFGSRPVDSSY